MLFIQNKTKILLIFFLLLFYVNCSVCHTTTNYHQEKKVATFETNFVPDALKIMLRSQEMKNLTDSKSNVHRLLQVNSQSSHIHYTSSPFVFESWLFLGVESS